MKVILLQDVPKIGKKNTIHEVAEGYGRNYLLPRKLAAEASPGKINEMNEFQKADERKKEQVLEQAQKMVAKLEKVVLSLQVKVGEGGRLFGAVSSKEIADQLLKEFKLKIDKKKIVLSNPIKSLGEYTIPVKLHPEVHAKIKIKVIEAK